MTPDRALNVVVTVPAASSELASDRLWLLGATAVEERALGTAPRESVELRAALGDDEVLLTALLADLDYPWRLEWVDLSVTETWRQYATTTVIDELLTIVPAWLGDAVDATSEERDGLMRLYIEPGATFGLGNHPTTVACLRALRSVVQPGDRVLDVGTGSGVLAVAAVRLGAASAHGSDINPASLDVVALNASRNNVSGAVTVTIDPLHHLAEPYDIVVANILAPTLIDLASDLVRLTGRVLVISGLLAERYEHVVDALSPLRRERVFEADGWVAIELRR